MPHFQTTEKSSQKRYRSTRTGRLISHAERVAAARTRIVADRRRGKQTPAWILELAKEGKD